MKWWAWPLVSLLGLGAGMASALGMAGLLPGTDPLGFGDVAVDRWVSDYAIGSQAADPYTRARVARHGLLALAKSEAIYFTRSTDNSGELLRERCRYRVSGGAMPARWWSVTLYDTASRLPDNSDGALSFDASRAGEGAWVAEIAATPPAGDTAWISSRNARTFDLTLRLYMPAPAVLDDPGTALRPPSIERIECAGADD